LVLLSHWHWEPISAPVHWSLTSLPASEKSARLAQQVPVAAPAYPATQWRLCFAQLVAQMVEMGAWFV
jgi:hypothetical protein